MDAISELLAYVYGACMIEICVSFVVYGITAAQAYIYWQRFPSDSSWIRWTVVVVFVIETVHTAVCLKMMYEYAITFWGNLLIVLKIDWTAGVSILLTAVLVFIVETFFVRRIWILSHGNVIVTLIPGIFVVLEAGFNLVNCVLLLKGGEWTQFRSDELTYVVTVIALVIMVITDLMTASLLIYYLRKSRTGFDAMDHHLAKVQIYVINSGALTVAIAVSVLLTFMLSRQSLVYGGLEEVLCKFYTNAFLGTLNVRESKATRRQASNVHARNHDATEFSTFRVRYNDPQRPLQIHQRIEITRDSPTGTLLKARGTVDEELGQDECSAIGYAI